MTLNEILKKGGKRLERKRVGRGPGSGLGKTSGRGHKGAKSRSGWKRREYYEGGQMPLIRRVPKRGFSNAPFRRRYDIVNLTLLEARFEDGENVDLETLVRREVIKSRHGRLKVLGDGELTKKLFIRAEKASDSARRKVEEAGGRIEVAAEAANQKKA